MWVFFSATKRSRLAADPLSEGFVRSLAHPGANMSGFTVLEPSVGAELLRLLREVRAPCYPRCGPGPARLFRGGSPRRLAADGGACSGQRCPPLIAPRDRDLHGRPQKRRKVSGPDASEFTAVGCKKTR